MSVKVYPVMKTAESIEDYEVFINGQKVELNTARVSAYQLTVFEYYAAHLVGIRLRADLQTLAPIIPNRTILNQNILTSQEDFLLRM